MSTLRLISDELRPKAVDVVFVHGLAGDALETWRSKTQPELFWPSWLAEDHPDIAVWTVGYTAPKLNWRFVSRVRQDVLPLFDRGGQILDLVASRGLGDRPILFVAHSLGGLVVKQLLRRAHDAAGANDRWSKIRDNTKTVVFLATPHTGSGVASWAKALGLLFRPSINTAELIENGAALRDLKNWYANNSANVGTLAFFEARPSFGPVPIVDQVSADPGVGRAQIAIDADHFGIAKISSRSEHVYRSVSDEISRLAAGPRLATASPWNLPTTLQPLGRDALVETLVANMTATSGKSLLILGGPAIGKSTLALFAANDPRVAERFGIRRVFLRLDQEGATSAALVRRAIARSVGLLDDERNWIRAVEELRAAPSLLILDNFETSWEHDAETCEALLRDLAAVPTLTVCVTLRGAERPAHVIWDVAPEVPKLDPAVSQQLFEQVSGVSDEEDPLLIQLLDQMDGIPLAIELLGEQRQFTSLADLWREWNQRKVSLLARADKPLDRLGNLAVSIDLSLASPRVTDAATLLFKMLGRLPAGFAAGGLQNLVGDRSYDSASALRRTRLAYDRGDRIVMLAPIREYAAALPLVAEQESIIASYFLNLLRCHAPEVGKASAGVGIKVLAAEAGNLENVVRLALACGMVDAFEELSSSLGDFQRFSGLGSPTLLLEVSAAAQEAGKQRIAGRAMFRAGEVYLHRSNYASAIDAFTDGHHALVASGEKLSATSCTKCVGDVLWELGRFDEARQMFCRALRGYRRLLQLRPGAATGMANCWCRLAAIAIAERKPQVARKALSRAGALYKSPADPLGEANCTLLSGKIAILEGAIGDAEVAFNDSLARFTSLGDCEGQGEAELGLAAVAEYSQDVAGRATHLRSALDRFRVQKSQFWIGHAHYLLAEGARSHNRTTHVEAARQAWSSIKRPDLLELLKG